MRTRGCDTVEIRATIHVTHARIHTHIYTRGQRADIHVSRRNRIATGVATLCDGDASR